MRVQYAQTFMHVSIFGNSFLTVQNLGMMKKMNAQEGPKYAHNDFRSSVAIFACMQAHCT